MAKHTIFDMSHNKEIFDKDMDEEEARKFFGSEVEVILKQGNLTFLAQKDRTLQPPNPFHPVVKGPIVIIEDSEFWDGQD